MQSYSFHKRRADVRVCAGGGLYSILGVSNTASKEQIKAAYRKLAQTLHPDKHAKSQVDTTAAFLRCRLACEILTDTQKRQEYDNVHLQSIPQQEACIQQQPEPLRKPAASSSASSRHPYNNPAQQPVDTTMVSAAVAAAGACSSGLSLPTLACRTQQQPATASDTLLQHTVAATTRQLLLEQHNAVLDQFSSTQDALDFLQQLSQQEDLLGMAAEDYRQPQALYRAGNLSNCSTAANPSGSDRQSSKGDDGSACADLQQLQQQQRWGNFNPGEFAPSPKLQ